MSKIVGITGATGFIGRQLLMRHLAQGDTVRVFSRRSGNAIELPKNSYQLFQGDLCGLEDLSPFVDGVDILYHCAGEIHDSVRMDSLHISGTRRLTEAAADKIGHWVQLSSVGVYGRMASGSITEYSALNPVGPYEITKAESDQIVIDAAKKSGFRFSILRPSNVYGETMTNQSLFKMVAMIDRGLFFYIGKPGSSANYIHVDNVVEGLMCCGSLPLAQSGIYNLSDYCTLEHFVEVIADMLGRTSPWLRVPEQVATLTSLVLGKLPGFPLTQSRVKALTNRSTYPISHIQNELGYQHVISMENGLLKLVKTYKQRFSSGKT